METLLSLSSFQSSQYHHTQCDQDPKDTCHLLGRIGVRAYCSHETTGAPTSPGSACNSTNAKGEKIVYPEFGQDTTFWTSVFVQHLVNILISVLLL
jgi:hypothetical protein